MIIHICDRCGRRTRTLESFCVENGPRFDIGPCCISKPYKVPVPPDVRLEVVVREGGGK
jgi:hypothetical protein